jgi:putative ABC transport system permease protein
MRIPVRRGRVFTADDRRGSPRVIVVNLLLADRYFPNENPIGRRMKVNQGPSDWREIVGVVGDVKQYGLGDRSSAQVYEPYLQHPYFSGFSLVIRTAGDDPTTVIPGIRNIVRSLDSEVPLSRVRRLDDIVSRSISPQRFSAVLIVLFGAAALLLAAIGVYGVMAYTVGLRSREFAIRIAHGAARRDILRLVLTGAATLTGIGVAVGLVAAWLLRRTIESLLFGVTPEDRLTYALVGLLLASVAMIASAVPAFRATRVDPMAALRG